MALKNLTTGKIYPFQILQADSFLSRLIGLLGTDHPDPYRGIHIDPCHGIHTFGMKYPIDLLFLDKDGYVLKAMDELKPNKAIKGMSHGKSVIELPPGSIAEHGIKVGERVEVITDGVYHPAANELRNLFHWPINACIALLWSRFVLHAIGDWLEHSGPINLGILIHNTILFVLFLTRRKSVETSHRLIDWLIPAFTIACTMLLLSDATINSLIYVVSITIQSIGILGIIFSLLSLGRSFGIIPANRRIKISGAYRIVRHPVYASELLFYLGFLLGNFSIRNLIIVILIIGGQIWRSLAEEKLLSGDEGYRSYLNSVRYRFIPGLF